MVRASVQIGTAFGLAATAIAATATARCSHAPPMSPRIPATSLRTQGRARHKRSLEDDRYYYCCYCEKFNQE